MRGLEFVRGLAGIRGLPGVRGLAGVRALTCVLGLTGVGGLGATLSCKQNTCSDITLTITDGKDYSGSSWSEQVEKNFCCTCYENKQIQGSSTPLLHTV